MKRTGFKPKAAGEKPAPAFKRKRRKQVEGHHDSRYLAACKGRPCYLRIPGICRCLPKDETVVPCHANWAEYGKGMGIKAKDIFTVPGCFQCHQWLDSGDSERQGKKDAWESAYKKWEVDRCV